MKRHPGLTSTAFVIVSAFLLLAAIAFNTTVMTAKLHFKKDPVPQPRDFHDLPPLMGRWLQVSADKLLDREVQDTLGTDKYVYRDYIRVERCGGDLLAYTYHLKEKPDDKTFDLAHEEELDDGMNQIVDKFNNANFDDKVAMIQSALKGKTPAERQQIVLALQMMPSHASDVVNVGLTYYTGLVDTVAHIPDRCYIADGYVPSDYTVPTWDLGPDAGGHPRPLEVRFISFEDNTGTNRVSKCVAYVFHCNGHYESDPLGVRQRLQSLTQRYGYYAKIELMTLGSDKDAAAAGMRDFLSAAQAQIETCFPDWTKLTGQHS